MMFLLLKALKEYLLNFLLRRIKTTGNLKLMKIKIPPYPNFKISEQAFDNDVESNSVITKDSNVLSNQLIMVAKFPSGEKRVIKARPVRYQNKLFVTAFPNPVHLFLSTAIEQFNLSEKFKQENFIKCGKKIGDDIYILTIEENGTHDCYNHYIKNRASSIIMLVSALEAYLNHIIPNNFIYSAIRKEKIVEFDKTDIESSKLSFKEKLIDVLPRAINEVDFWTKILKERSILLELYNTRKEIIHLKTNSQDDFDRYFTAIDKMLDLDISSAIETTINFMNLASDNFIEKADQ